MLISKAPATAWQQCVFGSSRFPLLANPIASRRYATKFEDIQSELLARKLPLLYDAPTETPSYLLDATLEDFLPPSPVSAYPVPPRQKKLGRFAPLRPGHHLVYFPPGYPLSSLLPDGTDPAQSPGEPFVRRMWAGGRIKFFPNSRLKLRLNGHKATCLERISNVAIKGKEGEEKIFVTIERRFTGTRWTSNRWAFETNVGAAYLFEDPFQRAPGEVIRKKLLEDTNCSMIEERDIVFMRERTPEEVTDAAKTPSKLVTPPHEPTHSVTLTPTPSLLFRFSALTFNAHRIHLDKLYCTDTEGHRNLLVHGPLSLVLMLELLNRYLAEHNPLHGVKPFVIPQKTIESVEYRNIAPLYAEEQMKVCLRDREDGEFDIWVENKDGGLVVKGTAKTVTVESVRHAISRRAGRKDTANPQSQEASLQSDEEAQSHLQPQHEASS